jgi:hypothetical protein
MVSPSFAGSQVGLKIIVITGSGVENVINEIPPEPFAVRVVDANNRPVTGATVSFTAPSSGPGGAFPTGPGFSTFSDEEGRALGVLYRPNSVEGSYMIQVRAEYMGEMAAASIRQNNVMTKKNGRSMSRTLVIAVIAGAGAAIAAAGLSAGGGSSSSSPPPPPGVPTITFGTSSIGGQ